MALVSMKRETPILLDRALTMTRHLMIQDYRDSEHGNYRTNPKRKCGLFEHAYGQSFSMTDRDVLIDEAQTCIKNFFQSEIFATAREIGTDKWLFIDQKSIGFQSGIENFCLEGTTIFASPDFVFLNEKDELELVDWKTGKVSNTLSIQMVCYTIGRRVKFQILCLSKWFVIPCMQWTSGQYP